MKLARSTAYALVAILLLGAVGTGISTAAKSKKVRTKVTISFQGSDYGDTFSGKVKAKGKKVPRKVKRKCKRGRRVTVFRKTGSGRQRIGRDRTDRRGRYVVRVGGLADAGRYFAQAKRKKVRKGGKRYICKKRRSKRITVS